MGVADNKTYKNDYIFTENRLNTAEDNPSINDEPKINSTIKENPYRANVEIEGKEVVLQDDLSALFKAVGKRHSKGGMDVLLKPNAFVFSDFDKLKISKEEHELFELKEGGTPAETLKKNVDPKHYNTLTNILSDPTKDDLSKKTAMRMVDKYLKTLGNIAFIQESKKGFPQGVPEFAQGTAPVYDDDLNDKIDSNKQYAKAGGTILPKAQFGNNPFYKQPPKVTVNKLNPAYQWAAQQAIPPSYWDGSGQFHSPSNQWPATGAPVQPVQPVLPKSGWDASGQFYSPFPNVGTQATNQVQPSSVLAPSGNKRYSGHSIQPGTTGDGVGIAQEDIIQNLIKDKSAKFEYKSPWKTPESFYQKKYENTQNTTEDTLETGKVTGDEQGSISADWNFTPWQKLSQMYNWGQYANVKKYMPIRSRFDATYVDPSLLNPEQQIGDMKGIANQQISSLGTLNPILRNAQAAGTTGELLNQIAQVRSQYDNQNAQILNQTRQYNNQVKNQETQTNMVNDQQYYKEAVEGRKNFDNMKQFMANTAFNNTLRDVETNQKLAYNLLTQNNPAYGFDWKTGRFNRNKKDIRDAQGTAGTNEFAGMLAEIMKMPNTDEKWRNVANLLKIQKISPYLQSQSQIPDFFGTSQKKGGRVGKNPYKNNTRY